MHKSIEQLDDVKYEAPCIQGQQFYSAVGPKLETITRVIFKTLSL